MRQYTLADARRLWLHVQAGGKWDYRIDTPRLGALIAQLEQADETIRRLIEEKNQP